MQPWGRVCLAPVQAVDGQSMVDANGHQHAGLTQRCC